MDAEAIHRGWNVLYIGIVFLALTGLQLWTDKTLVRGSPVTRRKQPVDFWVGVVLTSALGAFCVTLAFSRIL
jgi:hypothetical protein